MKSSEFIPTNNKRNEPDMSVVSLLTLVKQKRKPLTANELADKRKVKKKGSPWTG